MCLLSLLMADSTFVTLPVLLSGGNFESNLYSKAVMHSGDFRAALLTLKFRVASFWTQNKIVSLSDAPPVRLMLQFFKARARTDLF